jgi:glycosyltransferase involved in cell wall biosynthesis
MTVHYAQPLMKTDNSMIQLSVVVITYNEEENIERCLKSIVSVADEILVVDSYSTDKTVAIAESMGARVIQNPFKGFIQQRAFAVKNAKFDYILALDADEVVSPELLVSLQSAKEDWTCDCYYTNRLNKFGQRWIRHGAWYPDRKMRFFDRRKVTFGGLEPHDQILPDEGVSTGFLKGDLQHFMQENIFERIQKINEFSTVAARSLHKKGVKGTYFRLMYKPFARFWGDYLFKWGMLDGFYGFFLACASAHYAFYREAKLIEMQRYKIKETEKKAKRVDERIME